MTACYIISLIWLIKNQHREPFFDRNYRNWRIRTIHQTHRTWIIRTTYMSQWNSLHMDNLANPQNINNTDPHQTHRVSTTQTLIRLTVSTTRTLIRLTEYQQHGHSSDSQSLNNTDPHQTHIVSTTRTLIRLTESQQHGPFNWPIKSK